MAATVNRTSSESLGDLSQGRSALAAVQIYVEVVFGYCSGLIAVRHFAERGGPGMSIPGHLWLPADDPDSSPSLIRAIELARRSRSALYVIPGTVGSRGQASAGHVRQLRTILIDLDQGDIAAKRAHLVGHLGQPTLEVASGGLTEDGQVKLHLYWALSEPAEGDDVRLVCRLRLAIAAKVGGDRSFQSPHQPIRVAGSWHWKTGQARLVAIQAHRPLEHHLPDLAEAIDAMPPMVAASTEPAKGSKPKLDDVLTSPVREGGQDGWTRFEGASAAIGHYVRQAHEGRLSQDEAWQAVGEYNAAMLRPPWDLERLFEEFDRLRARHAQRNGPPKQPLSEQAEAKSAGILLFPLGVLLDDRSPVPDDLIEPRLLTPGGLFVFGGAAKIGKSSFVLTLLAHLAAGISFLGFKPPRPLRIAYLQAEVELPYLRERLNGIRLAQEHLELARHNLLVSPSTRMILDAANAQQVAEVITAGIEGRPFDVVALDPLRNLFDPGPDGGSENDNSAMLFFLRERIEVLRQAAGPQAGIILIHHTRKPSGREAGDDPFHLLSGASALRGYYTAGAVLLRPDESPYRRTLHVELRNGPPIGPLELDYQDGQWRERDLLDVRIVGQTQGERLDAERERRHDVIVDLLLSEARAGRIYTQHQFAEAFEGKAGLGGVNTIDKRISVLATQGHIRFFKSAEIYGLPAAARSKFGYLCVEGMVLSGPADIADPDTGELRALQQPIRPTHYKCPHSGGVLPVEDPKHWVYHDADEAAP